MNPPGSQGEICKLKELLDRAVAKCGPGEFGRSTPASAALPVLAEATTSIRAFLSQNPGSEEGWRLLSRSEEALLRTKSAREAHETAMRLAKKRSKRDRKRLARLRENEAALAFPLSWKQLRSLADFLDDAVGGKPKAASLEKTKEWLANHQIDEPESVLAALVALGARDDHNVAIVLTTSIKRTAVPD